jgi:hypothetical protein
VPGGREDAHVGTDLGDDDLCGAPLNAGDAAQQLNGCRERGDAFLDRVGEPVDLCIEEVQVGEDRADQQRVQVVEATLQRLAQRGELLAQAALGQLGKNVGLGGAGHERVEHRPAGGAQQVGGDAVELDVGFLQRLVHPLRPRAGARRSASCDTWSAGAARGSAWAARNSPAAAPPPTAGTARPHPRHRSCGPAPA